MISSHIATWIIAASATAGVIIRPGGIPEFIWALCGALLLVLLGLLSWTDAWFAVNKGTDVYFFLVGMMLLSELARTEGLFDWLAQYAVVHAKNSASRLFIIIYLVGTVVTVFLSNDATAVVLTPAVYTAARKAGLEPLPYLLVCAFIANAASFVLPISNPANLVVFGEHLPHLAEWLRLFALPSIVSILLTFLVLRWTQRRALRAEMTVTIGLTPLPRGGLLTAIGLALTTLILLFASALGFNLGLPTLCASLVVAVMVLVTGRQPLLPLIKGISWSVIPLVAGLFVLVEGLNATGVLSELAAILKRAADADLQATTWASGILVAIGSNLINNLPMGLIAATTSQTAHVPPLVTAGMLIGVDLGPNLSASGSLATILWLIVLRREGEHVTALQFLKIGALIMPPALIGALLALSLVSP